MVTRKGRLYAKCLMITERQKWCEMEALANKEQDREARIQAYAEALDFFIEEPKAISDPTLGLFIDFFKEKIEAELERRAKGLGTQKQLVKA